MNTLDLDITRAYFRMAEARRQRLWLERIWRPDMFKWEKRGAPPTPAAVTLVRYQELARIGMDENRMVQMADLETASLAEMEALAAEHPVAPHFEDIKGLSLRMCAYFVAASGDIERCPTVASFWKGMGLDVLPDGTVPRRMRGSKVERRIPCLPHVSLCGEIIRQRFLVSGDALYALYKEFRAKYDTKYPERPKIFNHKAGLRGVQKVLYACLWREWRLARGLPAPDPYAFDILMHPVGHMRRIQDFYQAAAQR